jgi:acyl-CoA thioester hydrolase
MWTKLATLFNSSVMNYSKTVEIRWSDLDPNFHIRHSVYYDFGAFIRMTFLTEAGLGTDILMKNQLGPILFREECIFKREIHFNDIVSINLQLKQSNASYSRWTMQHEIIKNGDITAALITVDGAWMNTAKRKLTVPPPFVTPAMDMIPRATDYQLIERKTT